MDTSALHTVTETFAAYLSELTPGDLATATPCTGWDINDLYQHMLQENVHFGLAVADAHDAPPDLLPEDSTSAAAPRHALDADYRRTAAYMEGAFAAAAEPTQTRQVPGIPGARTIHELYEMQLCDTVIHTWDLTRAVGVSYEGDPAIVQTVLRRLEQLPDSARGADKSFGDIQGSAEPGNTDLERVVLLSGRAL